MALEMRTVRICDGCGTDVGVAEVQVLIDGVMQVSIDLCADDRTKAVGFVQALRFASDPQQAEAAKDAPKVKVAKVKTKVKAKGKSGAPHKLKAVVQESESEESKPRRGRPKGFKMPTETCPEPGCGRVLSRQNMARHLATHEAAHAA